MDYIHIANQPPLPLAADHYAIGRGHDCDIRLDTDDAAISRHHALLERDRDSNWTLQDLGSLNGIRVNGQKVTGSAVLRTGDEVRIGGTLLTFTSEMQPFQMEETETLSLLHEADRAVVPARIPPRPTPAPQTPALRQAEWLVTGSASSPSPSVADRDTTLRPASGRHLQALALGMIAVPSLIYMLLLRQAIQDGRSGAGKVALFLDKHLNDGKLNSQYDQALLGAKICLAVGLMGAALLLYALLTNAPRDYS